MTLRPEVLPGELVEAVRRLAAREQVLLAFDFDGVLAPIVLDPMQARPLPAARDALYALAATPGTSLALVSGRPLDQLRLLADPPPGTALVGSHGAESDPALDLGDTLDGAARQLLKQVSDQLGQIRDRFPGTAVEHKPTAAVLHTRGADRPIAAAATQAALDGPARWDGVHPIAGKEVVELAVTDVTKGTALRQLRARTGPATGGVLYVGDDVTDERAFAVLDDDAGDVTVKVGDGNTAARHRIPDPPAVARLLQTIAALRSR
ncbi:MAG TPA: trehalose-phosphatase [Kineosporiaceae bacterium]|jgi:trehalose-phosphatase|nr:trehalose-phosphatase [Kineosporiaceae bacterium]